MNKIQRILWLAVVVIALGIPANLQAMSYCGGEPVNHFDPDGRCAKGVWAGWTDSGVPASASPAFMAGYYGGGVASGFNEGWQGGQEIVANTFSFGGTDALGLTDTSQLQGADYTGSRILATIGRQSLITAATFGTAALAQGGSQAALYGYQGLQVYNAASSGYAIGTGINQVENGNNWGYVSIVGGGFGVAGGFTVTAVAPELNTFGSAAEGGVLNGANYAQRTFSSTFSTPTGPLAGQTVEDVAAALRSGTLTPANVPIQYIVQDGNTLMLNTRSAQALEQAGIPRSAWNAVDMTEDAAAQARLAAQLQRNGLPSQGTPTVTPSGH